MAIWAQAKLPVGEFDMVVFLLAGALVGAAIGGAIGYGLAGPRYWYYGPNPYYANAFLAPYLSPWFAPTPRMYCTNAFY